MEATFQCLTHSTRLVYTLDEESGHVHRDIRATGARVRCTLKEGLPLESLRKVAQGEKVMHAPMGDTKQYPIVRPLMVGGAVTFEREEIRETTSALGAVVGAGE